MKVDASEKTVFGSLVAYQARPACKKEKALEILLSLFCLLLFIILGPFSAPVVLIALGKLGMEQRGQLAEPDSLMYHR